MLHDLPPQYGPEHRSDQMTALRKREQRCHPTLAGGAAQGVHHIRPEDSPLDGERTV